MEKPRQDFWGLWNISFGFFGIQIGFALQNANMSRIFQSLGESLDNLTVLWIAAPLTGLLVQPIIGHMSDRTWLGQLGRRRPYFLAGAIMASLALFAMPLSPALWVAAVMLWILDAAINVSMEPFRAFVGDILRKDQHTAGYSLQTAFIGAGAVVGSIFPWALDQFGVANEAVGGGIPDTVKYSFWFGGVVYLLSVLWTVFTTQEYSQDELSAFDTDGQEDTQSTVQALAAGSQTRALVWIGAGVLVAALVELAGLEKEMYLLAALLATYGLASIIAVQLAKNGRGNNMLSEIIGDFSGMPDIMKKLALTQFFSWSALFIMWIYTTPVVAQYAFGSSEPTSAAYNEGGNWVGIMFAVYNGVAALAALFLLPMMARHVGKVRTHMICLLAGSGGFTAFLFIRDPLMLLIAEVGIGIAWASILAMPYAILASSLPQQKLGIYMGLFNVFIVVPQLLVATAMGTVLKHYFPTEPIWTMAFAAIVMAIAALAMLRVKETPS